MAAMIKRRTRMVSIRLLDDEYQRLKEMCDARGARSVSDLAREAMFRMLAPGGGLVQTGPIEDRVRLLDEKVTLLRDQMAEVRKRLERDRPERPVIREMRSSVCDS